MIVLWCFSGIGWHRLWHLAVQNKIPRPALRPITQPPWASMRFLKEVINGTWYKRLTLKEYPKHTWGKGEIKISYSQN